MAWEAGPHGDSFQYLVPGITEELGLKEGECGFRSIGVASVKICDYYYNSNKKSKIDNKIRLQIYQLTWSPLTWRIKDYHIGYDSYGEYFYRTLSLTHFEMDI